MNVTVIGAGTVGLSIAYELSKSVDEVIVVDAGNVGEGASAGNAGWITPYLSSPRAAPGIVKDAVENFTDPQGAAKMHIPLDPTFATWGLRFLSASSKKRSEVARRNLQLFSRHAIEHFDRIADEGVEFEEHQTGLAVAFKDMDNFQGFVDGTPQVREYGYTGKITQYRGSEVQDFDSALSNAVRGVVHLEEERHVRPESLNAGLAKAVKANGGTLIENEPVKNLEKSGAQWLIETNLGRQICSDFVVVAAGIHSKQLLRKVQVNLPLEAAKGTSMTALGEGVAPSHALKLFEDMVACSPFNKGVRLSGTFDIGDRSSVINQKRLDMVIRNGLTYLKDWHPTQVEVQWAGHRPTSADDTPILGAVRKRPGLFVATGHGTLGVTLGPLTGALISEKITTAQQPRALAPFSLSRF